MNVKLLDFTQDALSLLLRTKNTRLKFESDPATWTDAQRAEHLSYMRDTIKSSWEFVAYTFEISGVTRAFTHQLVRTRTGVYAQESQRTVDVRDNPVLMPESVLAFERQRSYWQKAQAESVEAYTRMIEQGIPVQDARGILPTNMTTSIVAKFSLRTLHEMAKVRLCTRTQGEYQQVFREMRRLVIEQHPWVAEHRFIEVHCVSEGTCAFPRFGQTSCNFYDPRMNQRVVKEITFQKFWSEAPQVAVPVAKNGKTM